MLVVRHIWFKKRELFTPEVFNSTRVQPRNPIRSEITSFHYTLARDAQRAKFAEKVHKPPLGVNVIKFELNGFNASISVFWSPTDPPKSYDALIKVFKVIGYVLIIFCTYSNISGNISFQYINFPF